jgi:hypothetical protein
MASQNQVLKAGSIQNLGRSVTNFLHNTTDTARHLIDTFVTPTVRGLADARQKSERAIERPHQFADRNIRRRTTQEIASPFSFLASKNSFPL